jgi:hypothetical protein
LRAEHKVRPRAVEGEPQTPWRVIDYFDVIVHIMRTDLRGRYDLETLWGDAPRVGAEPEAAAEKPAKPARAAKPRKPRAPAKVKKPRKKKAAPSEAPQTGIAPE